MFGRKILFISGFYFVGKNEKKVPSWPYFSHPTAPSETEFCLVWPQEVQLVRNVKYEKILNLHVLYTEKRNTCISICDVSNENITFRPINLYYY